MSLRNQWYIAIESRALRRAPVSRTIFGERLVLFRTSSGRPAALLDRCAHRNMALSLGRVAGECVECPYHGWQYGRDGQCAHIPSTGCRGPAGVRVRSFAVTEQDGYVWVCPGEQPPTKRPFRFPNYLEPEWTSFKMRTRFEGTVDACLENFLDCPHTVFVHKGWFRTHETKTLKALVRRHRDGADVEFKGEPISKSIVSRLLFPRGKELKHTDRFILPNVSRVDYHFTDDRHFIITSQCTPISDEETEVYTMITYRFGRLGRLVRLFFEPLCRKIIHQDVDILHEHSAQLRRFGGPKYSHVETDLLGLHIQSLRAHCERGEEPPPDTEREITIAF